MINLKTYVDSCKKAIINGAAPLVYFYVPEVIYLNPIKNASGKYDFQYYVDSAKKDELSLNAVSDSETGNIYFNSKSAARVKSLTWAPYSGESNNPITVTVNKTESDTGSLDASISGGTATKYETDWIVWTLTYVTTSGQEMTVNAHSCLFPVPNPYQSQNSVISATAQPRNTKSSTWDIGVTGWLLGAHTVDGTGYTISSTTSGTTTTGEIGDVYGSYKLGFDTLESGTIATSGDRDLSNLYESGVGGSGFYNSNDSPSYKTGGVGSICIDSSRYTAVSQIPNLKVGVDLNRSTHSKEWGLTLNSCLYYDWYSNTAQPTTYNTAYDSFNHSNKSIAARRTTGSLSNAAITAGQTGTKTLVLMVYCYGNRSDYTRTGKGSFYLKCNFVNKAPLRAAYNSAINKNLYLQKEYFTDAAWNAYSSPCFEHFR